MFNKELKIRIHNALKSKPNYVGFAFGHKKTAGVNTKQFSIIVFVSKKVDQISEQDRIPEMIEGYPTDIQVQYTYSHLTVASNYHCINCANLVGKTPEDCDFTDQTVTTHYNTAYQVVGLPHRNKFQVGNPGNNYGKPAICGGMSGSAISGACTTTLIARDVVTEQLLILGNQHCLGFVTSGSLLPGVSKGPDDIVYNTEVISSVANKIWKQGESSSPNNVGAFYKTNYQGIFNAVPTPCAVYGSCYKADVAAFTLLPNTVPFQAIYELGDGPFKWITQEEFCLAYCGTPDCSACAGNTIYVYKSGRTTGTQTPQENHIIVQMDEDISSDGRKYSGILGIQHEDDADKPFGGGGDSGSPVLMEYDGELRILGILTWGGIGSIADDYTAEPYTTSPVIISVCPIWQVAEALQVKSWDLNEVVGENDGAIVVQSEDPTITVAGRPYTRLTGTTLPVTHTKD